MLNQVVIVGKLHRTEILGGDKTYAVIYLLVERNFKNADGEYEVDLIPIHLKNSMAEHAADLESGELVGVKCRVENENGTIRIMCEKLSILGA